jgi:hypothetical protein
MSAAAAIAARPLPQLLALAGAGLLAASWRDPQRLAVAALLALVAERRRGHRRETALRSPDERGAAAGSEARLAGQGGDALACQPGFAAGGRASLVRAAQGGLAAMAAAALMVLAGRALGVSALPQLLALAGAPRGRGAAAGPTRRGPARPAP